MHEDTTSSRQHRKTTWAVRADTMALIAEALRRGLTTEDREAAIRQAASRRSPRVAGAVAVLPLQGLITPRPSFLSMLFGGGGGLVSFRDAFREAVTADDIGAILIDVDSPGGLIDLVPETAAEIRAARGSKPIVAVANTMAASAAYWIASQADEVIVTPSGEVGSIGVFAAHEDWSKFDEQLGVTTTLISAGRFKTEGNPYEPLSDEARANIQDTVDQMYGMFIADVAAGRAATVAAVRDGFGEGRMVLAKQAVEAGMADRVETLEDTVARLVSSTPAAARAALAGLHASVEAEEPENVARCACGRFIPAGQTQCDDCKQSAAAAAETDTDAGDDGDPDEDTPEAGETASQAPEARRRVADLLFG